MPRKAVLDWLLEPAEPSIRYLTLTQLMGKGARDPEVREARSRIGSTGWAAEILGRRDPGGWWVRDRNLYYPKYTGTNWNLLALSDLGVTGSIPEVRQSCDLWVSRSPLQGGGVGGFGRSGRGHLCYTGNMARALIKFGYGADPRVRRALDWLVHTAHPKGGWSCWTFREEPATGRNLDSWEGLSAFAAYPRAKWTAPMEACVGKGVEFFLEKELHRQGPRYPPWYRFHWPVHYYYDLLVGLEVVTSLGYGGDRRLRFALDHLRKKRRPDGKWNLDAVHPDAAGATARWWVAHPKDRPLPLGFERVARPSKMITLRALTVLARVP